MGANPGETNTVFLSMTPTTDSVVARLSGDWLIKNAGELDRILQKIRPPDHSSVTINAQDLGRLDTAGAWLLHHWRSRIAESGITVKLTGASTEHLAMLKQVAYDYAPCDIGPPVKNWFVRLVEQIGEAVVDAFTVAAGFISFLGQLVIVWVRVLIKPGRFRLTPLIVHMEKVGFDALPIAGLISFLIGVVLAYQAALQLTELGAQIYVVDLVAIGVLRELAVLLTAIIVAGRSGSAFTAEIGSMKLNEEIDAMRVLGMDPIETLVMPRVLALVITLPLLTFFADMMGLLGGALMAWVSVDIGPGVFLERLPEVVGIENFWVGILKAPVFALLIGLVGCYEGMQVRGSAESVGRHTTRSVVESIFLVIVADALFSVFFSVIGV